MEQLIDNSFISDIQTKKYPGNRIGFPGGLWYRKGMFYAAYPVV